MLPDHELLRRYAQEGDETAFAELVARYVNFVYSIALRLVRHDAHAAQDVSQVVFTDLARKAWRLSGRATISGWLHTSVRYAAAKNRRAEARRVVREHHAFAMQDPSISPEEEIVWDQLQPLLDEAIGRLREQDRDLVTLRFFQNKSHREAGEVLGLGEEAARKRLDRALEKLRVHFARRGMTVSSALLSSMAANSIQAAPAGLAASLSGTALASAASVGVAGTIVHTLYMSTKTKVILAAAVVLAAATISTLSQQRTIAQLREELAVARTASDKAAKLSAGGGHPPAVPASTADQVALFSQILTDPDTNQAMRFRDLLSVIEKMNPADIRDLLDNFNKMPRSDQTAWTKNTLIARWAEVDPLAALAWAKAQTAGNSRWGALIMVFDSWAAKDPAAALAAMNQVNDAARGQIMVNTLARIATRDPQAALETVSRLPIGQQSGYGIVFYVWARNDPVAAAAALANLPPSESRNQAAQMLVSAWAQQDPASALAWANGLPPGATRNSALNSVLGPTDPQFAAANIDYLPPGAVRNGQIIGIATNLAARDPAGAFAWVDSVASGQTHDKAVQSVLAQVGQTDPAAAAAYLDRESDPAVRNVAIPQLATTWAEKDIQGALAWVHSLPAGDDNLRGNAFKNVMKAWTTNDPTVAAVYIQQNLSGDPTFGTLTGQAAGSWAAADPKAALAWAQTLPAGAGQDSAVRSAVSALANVDPQSAWSYAQELPAGNNRDKALGNVVVGWSSQDPAAAAKLLDNLPSGAIREDATAKVAENWSKQNPLAASQWIDTLPKGDARDGAIGAIIDQEWGNDMPASFKWAESMSKDSLRQVYLEAVAQEWGKRDAPAAANGVMSARLTDQQRADLLKAVQKGAAAK